MLLWVVFAILTAGVLLAVLRPLAIGRAPLDDARAFDAAVYRDQLAELAEDVARGRISQAEAGGARAEIARRLLVTGQDAPGRGAAPEAAPRTLAASRVILPVTLALVPLLTLSFYLMVGSPGLPGLPHAERIGSPIDRSDMAGLIAKVEERLRQHPEDGEGWDVIAPIYLRQGQNAEALRAFANALRLLGPSARRLEGYGEAGVLDGDGIISEAARGAFQQALRLEPGLPRSRFYLALALEQDGRLTEAAAAYRILLEETAADAPWRALVEGRLAALNAGAGSANLDRGTGGAKTVGRAASAPGPTEDDMAAAQGLSAEERDAMINKMVDGLAARLAKDGKDVEGWLRLIRAYMVLGKKDAAVEAIAEARRSLAGNIDATGRIHELARSLGLEAS